MSKSKEVVSYKERLAARAEEVGESMQPAVSNLSTAGGMMSLMDAPVPNDTLQCVVLAIGTERTMYDRPYDPEDKGPPNCYSQMLGYDDAFNPTSIPASNVPEPCAAACIECRWSKAKTALQGKGSRCKSRIKLVIAPASIVDHPDKLGKQYVIVSVPPTSGKNFTKYVQGLRANGLPPEGVITEIKLQKHRTNQFELVFSALSPIESEEAFAAIYSKMDADAFSPMLLQPYSYDEQEEAPKDSKKF